DGASGLYAPPEYPAVAHHDVVVAAIEAARRLGNRSHVGTTFSTDLAAARHFPSWSQEGSQKNVRFAELVKIADSPLVGFPRESSSGLRAVEPDPVPAVF
ncbi:MAG: hypothetical protein L0312_09155, partial [Acidobacteria bacterium]|nr:hypothetical protein [Acidobacteriota bacterium]